MEKLNLNIQMFASTNKTANYDLPQFVGTDKPTWLGDFNEAMSDIDAGMHGNATAISNMASDVETASATASQASQDVAGLTSTVNTLSSNVTAVTTTANNAQSTATSALNTANTANGKADTNASAITTLNTKYDALEENVLGLDGTILWENQNPTSDMVGNTVITLSSDDYDILEWYYRSETATNICYGQKVLKGYATEFLIPSLSSGNKQWVRRIIRDSDTQFTSWDCRQLEGTSATNSNSNCVPLYVIGYKINIFNGN